MNARDFITDHTTIAQAPLLPGIRLHLATEITPIWQATEAWLAEQNIEPPFWAFAWPGSVAIAQLLRREPERVAGLRVLDFAAGCGLAAIAAAQAGAGMVEACEIDPLAVAATRLNAALNHSAVTALHQDMVGEACRWDVIIAGDICYEAPMAAHILPWLRAMAGQGATVLIADPGRAYFSRLGCVEIARATIPTTRELEDRDSREVVIVQLLP